LAVVEAKESFEVFADVLNDGPVIMLGVVLEFTFSWALEKPSIKQHFTVL